MMDRVAGLGVDSVGVALLTDGKEIAVIAGGGHGDVLQFEDALNRTRLVSGLLNRDPPGGSRRLSPTGAQFAADFDQEITETGRLQQFCYLIYRPALGDG